MIFFQVQRTKNFYNNKVHNLSLSSVRQAIGAIGTIGTTGIV